MAPTLRLLSSGAIAMLVLFALVSGDAAAQCTDRDGDGYGRPGDASCPAGPETDCNDRSRTMHPGADEICDGFDNDCNGLLDDTEDCSQQLTQAAKQGGDTPLTTDPGRSWQPSVANNSHGYGAAFSDDRDCEPNPSVFFARTDPEGLELGEDHLIVCHDNFRATPSLTWTGSTYGLTWSDARATTPKREIYFALMDKNGRRIGEDARCSHTAPSSIQPRIAWSGESYGIVWVESLESGSDPSYFVRVSSDGDPGLEVPLHISDGSTLWQSLIWDGTRFALAVHKRSSAEESSKLLFVRLDVFGNRIEDPHLILERDAFDYPHFLTWTGTEYGLWWSEGDVYLTRIDLDGNAVDTANVSAYSNYPAFAQSLLGVAWNGHEYGLLWHYLMNELPPYSDQMRFSRSSEAGEMLPAAGKMEHEISTDLSGRTYEEVASILWNGRDYGIFWIDGMNGNSDLFFTRVAQDLDGDTYYGAADCNDQDNGVWSTPSAARNLRFSPDDSLWLWDEPLEPGGNGQVILYDVLRSTLPDDFYEADCLESDDDDLQAVDTSVPDPVGTAAYYQVRPQNDCGEAPLISAHTKMPISARSCP